MPDTPAVTPRLSEKLTALRRQEVLPPSALLASKLATLRRRHVNVLAGTGLAKLITLFVLLIGAEMLVDFWFDLPWGVRTVLLIGFLAAACVVAGRRIFLPILNQPGEDTVALMAEKRLAQFHTRLIASVQLTRPGAVPPGASASLVEALVKETETLAAPIEFSSIVPTRDLKKHGAWAVVLFTAGLMALASGGQDARDLLGRAFLSKAPVPRKTRVLVLNGDKKVGRGDSVVIEASAQGVTPPNGTLVIKYMLRRSEEFVMERATNSASRFVRPIENVQQNFNYAVKLGDGSSRTYRVEVVPRPTIVALQCEQAYPAYTGLPPLKRSPGDLVLLAGSTLHLAATATKPLKKASAKLEGLDKSIPLAVDPQNPTLITGDLPIPARNLTGFAIEMTDTTDMESRDPAIYHLEVLPDRSPSVKILAPSRKEELVTAEATLPIEFTAQDDFKVAKAWLRYKASDPENSPTNSVELDLSTNAAPQIHGEHRWIIKELAPSLNARAPGAGGSLTNGTRVEFWMEVADNNNVTGPGLGSSEHQLVRVVSLDEKRDELLTRTGDIVGTLSDMASDEERLNQNLGKIILEKKK